MLRARTWQLPVVALAAFALAAPLAAQNTSSDSAKARAQAPAQAAAAPSVSVSGLLFGSYNYQLPTTPAPLTNQNDNGFILDRAYLNFRAPAGDRLSVRVTTDVYQTNEAAPTGAGGTTFSNTAYTIRAKYAYFQYDVPKFANGASVFGRLGILQNVTIEHLETFWPRYISQTAVERAGYFSSADVGIAGQLTLPNKMGEVYATIVNGPGYTSRERDRFKDYAVRLSLTPLANSTDMPLLQTFTLTGWGYKGAVASSFVNGGTGQVAPVGEALDRSRAGVFVGLKDPRLVLGGEYDVRRDGGETGLNTAASPRTATKTTGHLVSGLALVRPFAFTNGTGKSPFGIVARYDKVSPTASTENIAVPPAPENAYHNIIAGVFYDVNARAQFALDYQESLSANNGVSAPPVPTQLKGYYAHFQVNF
jgi:hypothetical protein